MNTSAYAAMVPSLWVGMFAANLQRLGSTEPTASLAALGERLYVELHQLSPEEAAEAVYDDQGQATLWGDDLLPTPEPVSFRPDRRATVRSGGQSPEAVL